MKLDRVIKNGTIVTCSDTQQADIGIKEGKIQVIAKNIPILSGTEVIDASGKYVFPGGVDVHTHLELPVGGTVSKDDFATGTIAAACGGTTSIIDYATQFKGQTLTDAVNTWQSKAKDKAAIDYGFHVAIGDVNEAVLKEMENIINYGCSSFKLYMTYDEMRVEDDQFLQVLTHAKQYGGLICVHTENHHMLSYMIKKFKAERKIEPIYHALSRPPIVEAEAANRAIKLAMFVDAPLYIVHLTCKLSLDEVVRARLANGKIMSETCPQYLLLSEDNYKTTDFSAAKYVISPPLRSIDNQDFLWNGLAENNIQVVATDHCSFDFVGQKMKGRDFFGDIPNGMPGLELRMPLMFDRGVNAGKISINKFVEVTATNPAKIFGMYPQKGTIEVGSDADLIIFDPEIKKTITHDMLHENVDYTPYEGFKITGYPIMTLSRGEIIAKDGEFIGKKGRGKFIKRNKYTLL